jgi:hypothetical protein
MCKKEYFHLIANEKHRRMRKIQLEQDEETIVGDDNLKVFISKYYKKLFGAPVQNGFLLCENTILDIPQIFSA